MTLSIVESRQMRFLTVSTAHCKEYFVIVESELRYTRTSPNGDTDTVSVKRINQQFELDKLTLRSLSLDSNRDINLLSL